MATATINTPQFDLSSAVPETEDGKAVSAMPAFDLKSAFPEESLEASRPQDNIPEEQAAPLRQEAFDKMKSGIEQIPPSPVSEALRGFIRDIGKGGLEQYKEASFDYENASNIPTRNEGENDQDFNKRLQEFRQPLEDKEIAKGAMGQLGDTFNAALVLAAPEMSPKTWATLGTFMLADTTRQAVQNIFMPDLKPSIKDVLDLASFPIEGGMSHEVVTGIGGMISKAFTIKGVTPTIDLSPDLLKLFAEPQVTERPTPFVKASQEGWPAPNIETPTGPMSGGILDKLGINQNHYDVSQNTGLPVRVPISKILEISQDEKFDDFARAVMENEGGGQQEGGENAGERGEIAQSGSRQEAPSGEAQAGNDLRDDGSTKEVGGEKVASQSLPNGKIQQTENGNANAEQLESQSLGQQPKKELSQDFSKPNKNTQEEIGQQKEESSKESIPSEEENGKKTSGLAQSVEEDAVYKGLVKDLGDLPTYKTRDMSEIAKKVSDFIDKDPELAKKIALGDAPEQGSLRAQELFTGLKAKAFKEGNVPLIHELGTSEKASAMATELGQRVKALDSGDENNPINIIKDINKSRPKPTKDMVNDQGKTAKILKRESQIAIKKIPTWDDFIESIKC